MAGKAASTSCAESVCAVLLALRWVKESGELARAGVVVVSNFLLRVGGGVVAECGARAAWKQPGVEWWRGVRRC